MSENPQSDHEDWCDLAARLANQPHGKAQPESQDFEQWWATRTQEWIDTAGKYPANFAHDVWKAAGGK